MCTFVLYKVEVNISAARDMNLDLGFLKQVQCRKVFSNIPSSLTERRKKRVENAESIESRRPEYRGMKQMGDESVPYF